MDNFNIKKFLKDQYLAEGSCGYTPDGKPRSKPAGPDLMKEKVNENYSEGEIDDAVMELRDIVDEIEQKEGEARDIVRLYFPNELSRLDGYGAFSNMYSANRFDVTLGGFIDRLEEEGYEIEDGVAYVNEEKELKESISLSDYNEDVEKAIEVGIRVGSNFDEEDVMYYVHNNWMAGNLSADDAMRKISKYLSPK